MVVVIISIVVNLACPAPKVILCGSKRGTSGWKIWVHYHPVGCVDTVSWWSVLSLQQYKFYIPTSVHHPQCPAAGLIITMHSVMPWPHHHHHYYHHQHLVCISHQLILMIKTGPLGDEKSRDVQMAPSSGSLQGCVTRLRSIIMIFNTFFFFWWHFSIWAWCLVWLFWSLEQLKRPGTDESLSDVAPTPDRRAI